MTHVRPLPKLYQLTLIAALLAAGLSQTSDARAMEKGPRYTDGIHRDNATLAGSLLAESSPILDEVESGVESAGFLVLQVEDPGSSQLTTEVRGLATNLTLVARPGQKFSCVSGSLVDPGCPFDFDTLSLKLREEASEIPTEVTDALRSCLQISQIAQLQPDDFLLLIRVDLAGTSRATVSTTSTSTILTITLKDEGSFLCSLTKQ